MRRPVARAALAIVVCGMALMFAREMLIVWGVPDSDLLDPFNDANTYRAAGERLNAGHDLYRTQRGDRLVLLLDDYPVPLVSPPPIAAIWRPLTAIPFGFALWVAATWVALLGTVAYLVLKIGLPAAVVAAALSFPIGEQLVSANLAAFFPCLIVLVWRFRHHPHAGAIIGAMAALKLTPAVMGGWFVGMQRTRAMAWMLAGALLMTVIGLLGSGVTSYLDYAGVIRTIPPYPWTLSYLTGISWLSTAILVAGMCVSALLWRRPAIAFGVAVVTMVVGSPALLLPSFTLLLGALAPMVPDPLPRHVALQSVALMPSEWAERASHR